MALSRDVKELLPRWGRSGLAFEAWPVSVALPGDDEGLAPLLQAAPRDTLELMRAACSPGDRMPHVEAPARAAELLERLRRGGLVLRLGDLASFWSPAAEWVECYRALLVGLFGARVAARSEVRADLYLASPGAVSRFHADPSHNLVHQAAGRRRVHLSSPSDARLIDSASRPRVFLLRGEHPRYRPDCEDAATRFELTPGRALYLPLLGCHWLDNGPELSVSYTVSLRTPEVFREKRCHEFNARLERRGRRPSPYGRSPARDRCKAALETLLHHALPIRPRRPEQDVSWDREAPGGPPS